MPRQPYPLEALRRLRDERAEATTLSLATRVARSEAAQARVQERERTRREHEARTAEALTAERERLTLAGATGAELARLAEFERATRAQTRELLESEASARQALAEERAKEQQVREELGKLEAEAQLVRNHEARFHEHHAELQAKADEEAALEQWSARRH